MYGNNYRERFIRTGDLNESNNQNNLENAIENLRKDKVINNYIHFWNKFFNVGEEDENNFKKSNLNTLHESIWESLVIEFLLIEITIICY